MRPRGSSARLKHRGEKGDAALCLIIGCRQETAGVEKGRGSFVTWKELRPFCAPSFAPPVRFARRRGSVRSRRSTTATERQEVDPTQVGRDLESPTRTFDVR